MKTIPSGLLNCGTLVFGVRIVRRDGTILGWTQHNTDQTVTVDGADTVLLGNPGFTIDSLVSSAGLDVDNTEIVVISVDDEMNRADILAHLWDGAKVFFFRYNWKIPSAGYIAVKRGSFGNFTPQLGQFRVEFRDIRQALQQNTTWVFQEACRWRLGDARCTVDLTDFTFTATVTAVGTTPPVEPPTTGTLTGVVDAGFFGDSSLSEPTNHFEGGLLVFTSGPNMGEGRVVASDGGGEFTMVTVFPLLPLVGDHYSVSPQDFGSSSPANAFTAPSLTQVDDYFGEGKVTWLTGANAGTPGFKVKSFSAGVVGLSESTIFPVTVGDTFEIVAGCRKRWDIDCKTKFDNIINFGGEKDKPTRDDLIATPVGDS